MTDIPGFLRIVQGDTAVVGGLTLDTGTTIPSGLGAGGKIMAQQVGIRVRSADLSDTNQLPTVDAAGNTAMATIAANQGNGATGIIIPTGGVGIMGWLSGIYQKLTAALTTKAAPLTLVPLDNSALTTANTAVSILNAGNVAAGGYVVMSAAGFINQITTATTVSAGSNIPIAAGVTVNLVPSTNAVSAISPTGSVTVSGYGFT